MGDIIDTTPLQGIEPDRRESGTEYDMDTMRQSLVREAISAAYTEHIAGYPQIPAAFGPEREEAQRRWYLHYARGESLRAAHWRLIGRHQGRPNYHLTELRTGTYSAGTTEHVPHAALYSDETGLLVTVAPGAWVDEWLRREGLDHVDRNIRLAVRAWAHEEAVRTAGDLSQPWAPPQGQ